MKKLYSLLLSLLITSVGFGQVIVTDNFTYADGSLVPNGGWANHSGTAGDMLVASGQVVVEHGTPSEDASLAFTPVTGNIYYAIDFSVDDLGAPYSSAGTDFEYFAHFKNGATNFSARVDIVPPTGGGDYSVGISSDQSTADAVWATDLTYGVTYRATVRYDQDANIAELWIDASSSSDTSILGADQPDPGDSVESFALRQSDSDENETVRVDNLIVAQSFNETLSTNDFSTRSFSVYPNPTSSGFVNVVGSNSSNFENLNVAVYDVLGKLVINTTMSTERLNVSGLNSGIYIMKISQGNATSTKKLVIK
jgi:hypothetical protein